MRDLSDAVDELSDWAEKDRGKGFVLRAADNNPDPAKVGLIEISGELDWLTSHQGWEESRDSLDRHGIEAILWLGIGVERHILALLIVSKSSTLSIIDTILNLILSILW